VFEEFVNGFTESPVELPTALAVIAFSLLASVAAYFMYQIFYGSKNIGAGVHRTFIIGGPAITTIFLGIQFSIPLSLGLLGALSFVRFRTPVKDPAEIGFLLLLIASSIGAATQLFLITTILYVIVFIALSVQWLTRNKFSLLSQGHLMIALDQEAYTGLEQRLGELLRDHLRGVRLETMSVLEDRVSLYYQYRTQGDFDWSAFTARLNALAAPAKLELFIG
jgi:hypothetical protein